jgi:hypothetical protein
MASRAMSLASILCCGPHSTQRVDEMGYSFEMLDVDAEPLSTRVVDLHPLRHGSIRLLIHNNMNKARDTALLDPAIPIRALSALPDETAVLI